MTTPVQSDGAEDDRSEPMDDHSEIDDDAHDDTQVEADANADPQNGQNGADQVVSPVEPTAYSLFTNPPDLGNMRQRLFTVPEPIELSLAEFEQYFPFVDNVWRKTKLGADELASGSGSNTELCWCRLRRASSLKAPTAAKPTPEGKTRRRKRDKPDTSCNMAIKIVYTDSPDKKVIVSRTVSQDEQHTHDLDYVDSIKRNGAIMDVARREAVRSFLPLSIFWKMQQEPEKMEEAGGKFMKVSDVRNVQYAWRQENPTAPLKAHTGFNPQRAGFVGRLSARNSSPQQRKASPASTPASAAKPLHALLHQPLQQHQQHQQQQPWSVQPLSTPPAKQPLLHPSTMQPPLHHLQKPYPSQPPISPATPPQQPPQPQQPQQPQQQPQQPPAPSLSPGGPGPGAPPPQQASNTLQFPEHARAFLTPYLPDSRAVQARQRPHVTLTYASSLDGRIAILPQHRTPLSGPESKAMTHFLRSTHSAILIGVRTAIADNPALNCRLAGAAGYGASPHSGIMQPRPIIIDPHARLHIHPKMEMLKAVCEGRALGPWVIVSRSAQLHPTAVATLKAHRGEYLQIHDYNPLTGGFSWDTIFNVLYREGIQSIMIEGGAFVLSGLLRPNYAHLIDSVITTISPQYLGQQGVQVSQPTSVDEHGRIVPTLLKDVRWQPIGDIDVVMCARLQPPPPGMQQPQPPPQQPPQSQPQPPGKKQALPALKKETQGQGQAGQSQGPPPLEPRPTQTPGQPLLLPTPSGQPQPQNTGGQPGNASGGQNGPEDAKPSVSAGASVPVQTNGQFAVDRGTHPQYHHHHSPSTKSTKSTKSESSTGTPEAKRRKTEKTEKTEKKDG